MKNLQPYKENSNNQTTLYDQALGDNEKKKLTFNMRFLMKNQAQGGSDGQEGK